MMRQNTVRLFVGIGLACFALFSLAGWAIARLTHASLINNASSPWYGNPFSLGAILGLLFGVLFVAVAFINALVRLAQLRQWGWLATLALLAVFAMLFKILVFAAVMAFAAYLFIGPDTPATDSSSNSTVS